MGTFEIAEVLFRLFCHHTIGISALNGAWLPATTRAQDWFIIRWNDVSMWVEERFVLTVNHGTLEIAFFVGASRKEKPSSDWLFLRGVGVIVNGCHESKKGLAVDGQIPDE